MLKVPKLGLRLARSRLEHALLEVRDLVEAVHVELAHEGGEVLMLKPAPEDLAREALVVEDCEGTGIVVSFGVYQGS